MGAHATHTLSLSRSLSLSLFLARTLSLSLIHALSHLHSLLHTLSSIAGESGKSMMLDAAGEAVARGPNRLFQVS